MRLLTVQQRRCITDNDGTGNNADTDDDNDGIEDALDAFPMDASSLLIPTMTAWVTTRIPMMTVMVLRMRRYVPT